MIKALKSQAYLWFCRAKPFSNGISGGTHVYRAMRGEDVRPEVNTDVVFISSENMNHPEVKRMLRQPLD